MEQAKGHLKKIGPEKEKALAAEVIREMSGGARNDDYDDDEVTLSNGFTSWGDLEQRITEALCQLVMPNEAYQQE